MPSERNKIFVKILYFSHKTILLTIISSMIIVSILFGYITFNIKNANTMAVSYDLEERILKNTQEDKKIAYLTFDDGPSKKETRKILEILNEENVKATFFVIGKNVKEHPDIVKSAYDEGHYIANHGYSHDNSKLYKNPESFVNEIKNTDIEIGKAIGVNNYNSRLFRFPNGYMCSMYKKQKKWAANKLDELGYFYIDWNCLNRDSEKKTSNSELLKNLKKTSKNKNILIILMHDTGDVNCTSQVLKESIEYLKEEGYEFRNMYDFLVRSEDNL